MNQLHSLLCRLLSDGREYRHGTSDEFYDPYCDICSDTKGLNINPDGYCHDCYYCLRKRCLNVHSSLLATREQEVTEILPL